MHLYLIDAYRLLSLAEVIEIWNILEMLVSDGSLALGDRVHVRTEGPVRAHTWNRRWIAFASNGGGDDLALDLDPPEGGVVGQVITQSRDREKVRVLAPSFRAYLEGFAVDLEHGRYEATIEEEVLVWFSRRR
jgi:cell wall assembly regulator SMI1